MELELLEISEYTVEKLKDPFGILSGDRYEFTLLIEVDEEDELYRPAGLYVRVVYALASGGEGRVVSHEIRERGTDQLLDFGLEEDELAEAAAFCAAHAGEADHV